MQTKIPVVYENRWDFCAVEAIGLELVDKGTEKRLDEFWRFFCAEATEQKAARTIRDVFLQFVPNIWKNPRIICIFLICLEFEPGDGLHRQPVCQQTHDNIV